jgi:hypothetical protein
MTIGAQTANEHTLSAYANIWPFFLFMMDGSGRPGFRIPRPGFQGHNSKIRSDERYIAV